MRLTTVSLALTALFTTPCLAQQETILQKPSGESVTVHTDSSGTAVTTPGAAKAPVGTGAAGEQRHQQKVEELTNEGATITSETRNAK